MDYGHEQTDKELKALENRIRKEYGKAVKEAEQKLNDYLKSFDAKDKKMAERLKAGEITKDEYLNWRKKEMATGERWQALRDSLADTYQNANREASNMIQDNAYKAYADNFNFGTFEAERGSNVNTAFTLYSRDSVRELVKGNKDILPPPGEKVSRAIKEGKAKRWNRQQVQSVMLQGLLQGESIPKIAKRLSREVGEKNMHSAIRSARTMTTEAENAGRIDSYRRAQDMGIEVKKQWLATLDGRTRHSHRLLDGESVGVDETFSNGLKFPADPDGSPNEIYNCRCTLIADMSGYENDLTDRKTGKGFTDYETWKHEHEKQEKSGVVNGMDISDTWIRRKDEFDFEIDDVINAQGFDGLPRVVDEEEFDRLVQEANEGQGFIAQRTYSATSQEVLDNYRDELYHGHWYVDCSTGGAQYGQGMYCAADYTGKLSNGILQEMLDYQKQNLNYSGQESVHLVETFTLDSSTKFITQKAIVDDWISTYMPSDQARHLIRQNGGRKSVNGIYDNTDVKRWAVNIVNDGSYDIKRRIKELKNRGMSHQDASIKASRDEERYWLDKASKKGISTDIGSHAVTKGYDAIKTTHGTCGNDTVILNRTKVIIRRPK